MTGAFAACGPALALTHGEGTNKDALDTLYRSADFVGVGNGHVVYRRRADSHPVGGCGGRPVIPSDSGTAAGLGD